MPGFLVVGVFGSAAAGSEVDLGLSVGGSDGDDEPDGHSNVIM